MIVLKTMTGLKLGSLRRMATAVVVAAGIVFTSGLSANAAEEAREYESHDWSFYGLFGTYDRASLQRGYRVYKDVCASCHSLRLISFRNLVEIGFTEDEAKGIASEFTVEDGPDAEGDMFERTARLSDRIPSPYRNDNEARSINNGALPPDLSLIVKARHGGPNYIFALLNGYSEEAPEDFHLTDGMTYNPYFAGAEIAMPEPLFEDAVEYGDGTTASVEQMAEDVTHFLAWASEPTLDRRHQLGFQVMIFLILLTGLFWIVKRRTWKDMH
jgi:cytochrome c1